jgi:hypothetical protein
VSALREERGINDNLDCCMADVKSGACVRDDSSCEWLVRYRWVMKHESRSTKHEA